MAKGVKIKKNFLYRMLFLERSQQTTEMIERRKKNNIMQREKKNYKQQKWSDRRSIFLRILEWHFFFVQLHYKWQLLLRLRGRSFQKGSSCTEYAFILIQAVASMKSFLASMACFFLSLSHSSFATYIFTYFSFSGAHFMKNKWAIACHTAYEQFA